MPHHDKGTAETPLNRPVTRPKNATTHPGTEAQKVLSTRRDPEVIEKEKLARKAKKEAKERQNADEAARKEAAQHRIEQLRAQQAKDLEDEESEIPHQQPLAKGKKVQGPGAVHGKGKATKGSPSVTVKATNTATSAGNRERKRKGDLTKQDDESVHDEHPPAKRSKALPAAEQRTCPVPQRFEVTMDSVNHRNAKKRLSEAVDMGHENDPKTPVPSKKKTKTGLNEKQLTKGAPIRQTEALMALAGSKVVAPIRRTVLAGSKVVARRPTDIDLKTASEDDANEKEEMPTPRAQAPTDLEDVDIDLYQTPIALTPANRKRKARVMAEPEDKAETSDIEIVAMETLEEMRKRRALTSAADKPASRVRTAQDKSTQPTEKKSHSTSLSSRSSSAEIKSLKSRTTALNEVATARSLDSSTSKSKPKPATKTSKKSTIIEDDEFESLGDEDDAKEREAVLSSPMKGIDYRQSTGTKVKVERGDEETLSANEKKKVKDDVLPHFMQKYTSEIDCFAPLTEKDFRLLEDLYHRVMGRPLPYKLTKNSEVVKMISTKLSDYRTQFRIQGENNAKTLLNVYFDGDTVAIQDKEKRMEFGLYYCMEDEYKFQFKGSERPVGKFKASGRFLSKIFLDTFSIHYRYTLPKNPLPNWDTPIPVGGLALAAAAIDRALTLYRDGHNDYEKGILSIKQPPVSQAAKEKAMKNRMARGGSEGDNDKVPSTSRFHFSKGKYGNVVLAWHGVLVQKAKANFPDICGQARKIFGVMDVEIGNDNQRAQNINPEVRTRVGLDSESESDEENNAHEGDEEDHSNDGINNDANDGKSDDSIDDDADDGIDDDTDDGIDDDADDGNGNDGIDDDADEDADDGNGYKDDQNDAGPSHFEFEVVNSPQCYNHNDAEENDGHGAEETEEVDPGPSRHGGRRGTKARGCK